MSSKGKLLFIDDEPSLRKVFKVFFEDVGYTVFTAENGKETMAIYMENIPDIIILDYNLQEEYGLDLAAQILTIKKKDDFLKLIILTGSLFSAAEDIPKWKKSCGITAFFEKPCDFQELLETLDELMQEKIFLTGK